MFLKSGCSSNGVSLGVGVMGVMRLVFVDCMLFGTGFGCWLLAVGWFLLVGLGSGCCRGLGWC